MAVQVVPSSFEEAAEALREAAEAGRSARFSGAGTKPWGQPGTEPDVEILTGGLDSVREHNEGDLTAVLEAGVPLARAQQQFASAGQMLALDPPLGAAREATIGGILATADSGPMRHRYGTPRDLILGMTVALSDGTIARSGGKVIKNVAGYDIGKLFCGSFGTLGMILSVNLRLHPRPAQTITVLGVTSDPDTASRAAQALSAAPLELEALDIAWRGGRGGLLARCGGVRTPPRAERVATLMRQAGLEQVELVEDDAALWARQRAGQRSPDAALLRVAARPSVLPRLLRATDLCGGTLVGRAAFGQGYLEIEPDGVGRLAEQLPGDARTVLLDAPIATRAAAEVWGEGPAPALRELMHRVKARFDPGRVCSPGSFVGGI